MSTDLKIYCEKHKFTYSDFDIYDRIVPSVLLRLCQDIAGRHSEFAHVGYHDLLDQGALWIISKMYFKFLGKIEYGKEYTIKTWAHKKRLIYFPREYEICDENGEKVMIGISMWHIFSLRERKILNPATLNLANFDDFNVEYSNFDSTNILFSKELENFEGEKVISHLVTYTELDHNHHMNNTHYADLALDSIPDILEINRDLNELKILFLSECSKGDIINTLYMKDGSEHNIRGVRDDGTNVFVACFNFKGEN